MSRGRIALYFWGSCASLGLIVGLCWGLYFRHIEYTDDAYVQGNQVYITPLHEGFITQIHTDDSFLVKKGQLLAVLDMTDAKIALEKAEEDLAETVRQVCQQFHQVFVYAAEVESKKADLIRNAQDYLHREGVFREQGVSLEEYEHAIAALQAQYASLLMTGALYHKSLAAVQGTSVQSHPLVIQAADRFREAFVYLYRCKIYSPVEGLAAQRTAQVGMWVPAGQLLLSVIPLDQIWVNANYKETQLKHMRLGQSVKITVDLWGDTLPFQGKIVGLPGGAGNAFSLLPPQNLSGNWIKIVQRLPVRVALDPAALVRHPLRLGLSCSATVDTRESGGLMVPETTVGSPLYTTSIFEEEESGDFELVEAIVLANLDPVLLSYAETPFSLPPLDLDLPPILEEALQADQRLEGEIIQRAE